MENIKKSACFKKIKVNSSRSGVSNIRLGFQDWLSKRLKPGPWTALDFLLYFHISFFFFLFLSSFPFFYNGSTGKNKTNKNIFSELTFFY